MSIFDASALVKAFVDEPYSSSVRSYWQSQTTKYTTPFCFYEALNVLKSKWKYKSLLTLDQYVDAASRITAWYGTASQDIPDLDFSDLHVFMETRLLAKRTQLDLSDAFQIMSLKRGFLSMLKGDSQAVLVTADSPLAVAARTEGLKVWDVTREASPP